MKPVMSSGGVTPLYSPSSPSLATVCRRRAATLSASSADWFGVIGSLSCCWRPGRFGDQCLHNFGRNSDQVCNVWASGQGPHEEVAQFLGSAAVPFQSTKKMAVLPVGERP